MVGQNGEQLSVQEAAARVDAAFMAAQEAITNGDIAAVQAALTELEELRRAGDLTQNQVDRIPRLWIQYYQNDQAFRESTQYLADGDNDAARASLLRLQNLQNRGELTGNQMAVLRQLWIAYYQQNPVQVHAEVEQKYKNIAEQATDRWLADAADLLNQAQDEAAFRTLLTKIQNQANLTAEQQQLLAELEQRAEVIFPENRYQAELQQAREYLAEALSGSNSIRDRIQNFVQAHNQIETLEQQQLNTAEQQELQLTQTQRDQLRPVLDTAVATRIDELLQELAQLTLNTADDQMDELADLLALYIDQSIVPILQLQDIPNLQNRVDTAIRDLHERHREEQLGNLERQLQQLVATITADTYDLNAPITIDGTTHPDFAEATMGWLDEITALRAVQPPDQLSQDQEGRLNLLQNNLDRAQQFQNRVVELGNLDLLDQAELEANIAEAQQEQQIFAGFDPNQAGHEYAAAYQHQLDRATAEYQHRITEYAQGMRDLLTLAGNMLRQANYQPTQTFDVPVAGGTKQMTARQIIGLAFNTRTDILQRYQFLEQHQLNFDPAERQAVEATQARMTELQNIAEVQELIAQLTDDAQAGQLTPQQFAQRQQDIRDAIASNITAQADQNLLTQKVEALQPPEVTAEQFVQQVLQIENDLQNDPNFDVRALNYRYTDPIRGTTFPVTPVAYITAYRRVLTLNTNQNDFVQEVLTALQKRLEQVNRADLTAWQQAIHPRAWWQNANTEATTAVDPNADEATLQNRLTQAERYLQTFNTEVNNLAGTPQDPQANGALVLGHINETRTALQTRIDEVRARISEVRAENQKKQDEAQKAAAEKAAEQAALATWKTEVKPLTDAIEVIETEVDVAKVKPHSTAADAKDEQELTDIKTKLTDSKTDLERNTNNLDTDSQQYQLIKIEIVRLVGKDSKSGKYGDALEKVNAALARSKELKPVSQLTYPELIAEIWKVDPTKQDWGKTIPPSREKDLILAFNQERDPWAEGRDEKEKLEFLSIKYEYLLKHMDAKMYDGKGGASTNRAMLLEPDGGMLAIYGLNREELLRAVTYHPDWGQQTREMLRWLIETPAKKDADKPGYEDLFYEALAGGSGRANMSKFLDRRFPDNGDPNTTKAKRFAKLLFTSFDMLTITLQECQHNTRTRLHNNTINMIDPISVQDPLAAYIHALGRYGGNKKDWRGWWLVYLKDIPHNGRFGPGGNYHDLEEIQHLVKMHQDAYFPTEHIVGKIDVPGFCESFFPDTYDLVTLSQLDSKPKNGALPVEKITIMGETYDQDHENGGATGNETKIFDFDVYQVAFSGWQSLLELTYQDVGTNLTFQQIMEEIKEGGKGGLLSKWLQEAGKAKTYDPKHLRAALVPMLTHYIYRLITHFNGDVRAKKTLIVQITKALEHTRDVGGLSAFPDEMTQVIKNIQDKRLLVNPYYRRKDKIRKYARTYWKEEHEGADPPGFFMGMALKLFNRRNEDDHFYQIMRGKASPELPMNRNGTMIQEKKTS